MDHIGYLAILSETVLSLFAWLCVVIFMAGLLVLNRIDTLVHVAHEDCTAREDERRK